MRADLDPEKSRTAESPIPATRPAITAVAPIQARTLVTDRRPRSEWKSESRRTIPKAQTDHQTRIPGRGTKSRQILLQHVILTSVFSPRNRSTPHRDLGVKKCQNGRARFYCVQKCCASNGDNDSKWDDCGPVTGERFDSEGGESLPDVIGAVGHRCRRCRC